MLETNQTCERTNKYSIDFSETSFDLFPLAYTRNQYNGFQALGLTYEL